MGINNNFNTYGAKWSLSLQNNLLETITQKIWELPPAPVLGQNTIQGQTNNQEIIQYGIMVEILVQSKGNAITRFFSASVHIEN